jgi:Ca2+-binding EF-hand superfamily protein
MNEINYIMQVADLNGDGEIDFYEFVKAFSSQLPKVQESPKQS